MSIWRLLTGSGQRSVSSRFDSSSPEVPPRLDRDVRLLSPVPPPRHLGHSLLESPTESSTSLERDHGVSMSCSLDYHSSENTSSTTLSCSPPPSFEPPFPCKGRSRELRRRGRRRSRRPSEDDPERDQDDDDDDERGRDRWTPGHCTAPPWLHPNTSRTRAEGMLGNGVDGSFMVRSNPQGQLAISVRFDGRVYHYRIHNHQHDTLDTLEFHVCGSPRFSSLESLVHFHSVVDDEGHGLVTGLRFPVLTKPSKLFSLPMPKELETWQLPRSQLVVEHRLGGGQYGDVYRALWTRHQVHVAVKTLRETDAESEQELVREAALMAQSTSHPNLVSLVGVCAMSRPLFIVTEFMANGNLLDWLKANANVSTIELVAMAAQVAAGMAHLENLRIVHRDLAARNCLVSGDLLVKVGDFGLARPILSPSKVYVASPGSKFPIKWTAPEALALNTFTSKSDVWSFGVLLWEMASRGGVPYEHIDLDDLYDHLQAGHRMAHPADNAKLARLMDQCWRWHEEERPTFGVLHIGLEALLDDHLDTNQQCLLVSKEDEWHTMLRLLHKLRSGGQCERDHWHTLDALLAASEHSVAAILPVTARLDMRRCMQTLNSRQQPQFTNTLNHFEQLINTHLDTLASDTQSLKQQGYHPTTLIQ